MSLPLECVIDALRSLVGLFDLVKVGLVVDGSRGSPVGTSGLVSVVRFEGSPLRGGVAAGRPTGGPLAGPETLWQVLDQVRTGEPTVLRLVFG